MWWLRNRLRGQHGEGGAVAAIFAILVGFGALLGMGAIVVDVGGMYAEKAELQSGADAAAMAVAFGCAKGGATCDTSTAAGSLAGKYANHNALDNAASVDVVCGSGSILAACAGLGKCLSKPTAGKNYVQVQTSTLTSGGSKLLPPSFGKALVGSSWNGATVHACAQAGWSAPNVLQNSIAVTISECEWKLNTNNGTQYGPSAPFPPWPPNYLATLPARNAAGLNTPFITYTPAGTAPIAGSETVLTTKGFNNTCSSSNPGWDSPGKFGWLAKKSGCNASITGAEYVGAPGNAAASCEALLLNSYNTGAPIYMPVYSGIDTATGNYILAGFAAFVVTGWDVTSGNAGWTNKTEPSRVAIAQGITKAKDQNYCGNYTSSKSDVCLYGFFTQALIPADAVPGGSSGQNLGATTVSLSG